MLVRRIEIYRSRLHEFSVKVDRVDILTPVTLADMPVNMRALFHLGEAIGTLDSRLLAAFELHMSLQVCRVYIALRASRARVSLDIVLQVSASTPSHRIERFLVFMIKVLGLLDDYRVHARQIGMQLDYLRI